MSGVGRVLPIGMSAVATPEMNSSGNLERRPRVEPGRFEEQWPVFVVAMLRYRSSNLQLDEKVCIYFENCRASKLTRRQSQKIQQLGDRRVIRRSELASK
jgi:hypothetical protein